MPFVLQQMRQGMLFELPRIVSIDPHGWRSYRPTTGLTYDWTAKMPDRRTHRGPHPEDAELFAPAIWPRLQAATADYSWLLTRGYAEPSAIKIVGDRYALNDRQRVAVARSACRDQALDCRRARQVELDAIRGDRLWIDGFNLLTTVEVALGGGVVLAARDGCYRDIASVHGTYRKVEETRPAVEMAGQLIDSLGPAECVWYLDRAVGNSGRLRSILLDAARQRNWRWRVELVANPDPILSAATAVVATADSVILDRCARWTNLAREVIHSYIPGARVVPIAAC